MCKEGEWEYPSQCISYTVCTQCMHPQHHPSHPPHHYTAPTSCGCEQLCLPSGTSTTTCSCRDNYIINGNQCEGKPHLLLLSSCLPVPSWPGCTTFLLPLSDFKHTYLLIFFPSCLHPFLSLL